jgi:hypothetical protein
MGRINIYAPPSYDNPEDYDKPELLGWFESAKAAHWTDRDHNGNGSGGTGRGQAVYRTAGGKWVLEHWTAWQGETATHQYISDATARDWLLHNGEDEAVKIIFGDIAEEEDRRPGRPEVGNVINVRLGELLGRVDEFAADSRISRAEAVRQLVFGGLIKHYGY